MIEDLQDEYSLYAAEKKAPARKSALILFMLVFWIIYAAIIILASRNSITRTVKETRAAEIVENIDKYRFLVDSEEATLYFYNSLEGVRPYKILVERTGATKYHDAVEGLIAGPTDDALSQGAISFIPRKTRLLGLSVSEKTAFVNFSPEFSEDKTGAEIARVQVERTLRAINPYLEEIVILINGTELVD